MIKLPLLRRSRARAAAADAPAPVVSATPLPVLAGPAVIRGHLAVFPLRRRPVAGLPSVPAYASLTAALESGRARLHEMDGLRETEVENLTDTDLFAQAGETVRGGWQDWTMGVDLIVPRRSQRRRLSLREFCLQPGRWHFADRQEVTRAFGPASEPTAVDEALRRLPVSGPDVIGFAYAVNGTLRGAHLYASAGLFSEVWPGLLERVITEANLVPAGPAFVAVPSASETEAWLAQACEAAAAIEPAAVHGVTPRVTLVARDLPVPAAGGGGGSRLIGLETLDAGRSGLCVHQAILAAR